MQRQRRVRRAHRREGLLVPLDAEVGIVAALQHDLRRAEVDRLAAAAQDLLERVGPALGVLGRPVERAELAGRDADVGVVDVAVDQVRRDRRGVSEAAAAGGVSGAAERVQRGLGVELERLGRRDAAAIGSAIEQHAQVSHATELSRTSIGAPATERSAALRSRSPSRRLPAGPSGRGSAAWRPPPRSASPSRSRCRLPSASAPLPRQHRHPRRGRDCADSLDRFETVHHRHRDVDDHQIGLKLVDELDCLEPVTGLPDDLEVGLERQQRVHQLAHAGRVVGDDHAVGAQRRESTRGASMAQGHATDGDSNARSSEPANGPKVDHLGRPDHPEE